MQKSTKQQTINLKIAAITAVAANTPVYLLYGFIRLPIVVAPIIGWGIVLGAALFMVFISAWFLKHFSSGFSVTNGFLFGLTLTIITFILDLFFFCFLFGFGLSFYQWHVVVAYIEMMIIPMVVGHFFVRDKDYSLHSE